MTYLYPFLVCFNIFGNHYDYKWQILVITAYIYLFVKIAKEKSIFLALLLGYCTTYAILISVCKAYPYTDSSHQFYREPFLALTYLTASMLLLVLYKPDNFRNMLKYVIPILCTMVFAYKVHPFLPLQHLEPVTASLLSLLLPFAVTPLNLGMVFAAIIVTKGSTGLAAFCVSMSVFMFFKMEDKKKFFFYLVCVACGVYLVSLFFYGSELFNFNNRLPQWRMALELGLDNWLFGIGTGTFSHVMPSIQVNILHLREVFLWAHNDYLQFFVENGLIGMALFIPVFVEVVVISWRKPFLMAYIASWMVNSFSNFPNHLADQSLLTIICLTIVYEKRRIR